MGGTAEGGRRPLAWVAAPALVGGALVALQYRWVAAIGPLPPERRAPEDPIDKLYALSAPAAAASFGLILLLAVASIAAVRWLLARQIPREPHRPEQELGLLPAAVMLFLTNTGLTLAALIVASGIVGSKTLPLEAQVASGAIGQLSAAALAVWWLLASGRGPAVGLRGHRGSTLLAPLLLVCFVAPYASTLIATRWIYVVQGTGPELQSVVTQVLEARQVPLRFAALAVFAIVVAPLTEELLYRGILHGGLRSFGPVAAAVGSAALFSLVHGAPLPLLPLFALGLLLSAVREASGSLAGPIALHALFNATQVALMWTAP